MLRIITFALFATFASQPALSREILAVELVAVKEMSFTYDAAVTGSVQAVDTVSIGFRQGGRVVEVLVNEGDAVARDQPLAKIDPLQLRQSLSAAEASVVSASAAEAQARQAFVRAGSMLDRGVGTRAALDGAAQALSSAQGSLALANSGRDQAQRALNDAVIRAPTDAVVTVRSSEPGQIVAAAQPVISLALSGGREAVFQIPDSPLLAHAIGAPVTLQAIDLPDLHMNARITEIAPLVDPSSGSVTVRTKIDNAPTTVELLGASVRGSVHLQTGTGIAVPWTALTQIGDQTGVWVVDAENHASLSPVTIERFVDEIAILKSGITVGQIVVGAGSQLLYPGREVRDAALLKADPS